ncbi:MAG: hypothetical protein M0R80_21710 [Proteobacteria bacterium]|jgi:hypothetical protein|nr:hypothetical protein [Pseudomonadota bacterium]
MIKGSTGGVGIVPKVLLLVGTLNAVVSQFFISEEMIFSSFSIGTYSVFGLLLAFSILRLKRPSPLLKVMLTAVAFSTIGTLLYSIESETPSIYYVQHLLVPTGVLFISNVVRLDGKWLVAYIYLYVIAAVSVGLASAFFHGTGLMISAQYLVAGKNQLGPTIAVAAVLSVFMMFERITSSKLLSISIHLALIGAAVAALASIRNRAGLLAFFVVSLLYLVLSVFRGRYQGRLALLYVVSGGILASSIALGYTYEPVEFVKESIIVGRVSGDLDYFSSGRLEVAVTAVDSIARNIAFGSHEYRSKERGLPHAYAINELAKWGLLGGLPLILLYLYLWVYCGNRVLRITKITHSYARAALWLLLMGLITSSLEYAHPYGPGTSFVVVWYLVGLYDKESVASVEKASDTEINNEDRMVNT